MPKREPLPTPAEIRQWCLYFQSTWTPEEEQERAGSARGCAHRSAKCAAATLRRVRRAIVPRNRPLSAKAVSRSVPVNVILVRKGNDQYVFAYDEGAASVEALLETAIRFASDPGLNFGWDEAVAVCDAQDRLQTATQAR